VVAADGRNAHEDAGGGPLVQGHGRHEVWGLAAHPERAEYCTVGDDGTLRVWDAAGPGQAAVAALEGVARAVAYSPDGRFVAVGLGGDVGRGRTREDGRWVVVSTEDWEVVHRAHDTRAAITDVKFCPAGATLGVAARDGRLLLYDVSAGFSLRGVFDRHRSPLVRFDFSRDGKKVRTASATWELLYADTATGAHLPSAAAMRDVQWATQTVAVGWSMLGAWEGGEEGAGQDLTAVASSRSGALLAVGDSMGGLRIKRYPCPDVGAAFHRLRGHPGRVTGVAWLAGDERLVSTGGRDLCVLQWRVLPDEDGARAAAKAVAATPAEADDSEFRRPLGDYRPPDEFAAPGAASAAAADARESCLVAPSRAPPVDPRAPSERLRLEWVHGFRGHDTSGNLAFARNSALVYNVSALGVSLDADRHAQRHYRGHDADLTCLAVDPSRRLAASGQGGPVPRVHVWDACGATPRCALPAVHAGAVAAVAFSRDARRAVALSGSGRAHFACCLPSGDGAGSSATAPGSSAGVWEDGPASLRFVTGGEDGARFWRLWQGSLTSTAGIWGSKAKRQTVTCGACVAGTLVTGTVSGQLYAWRGRVVARAVDAFDPGTRHRAVNALHAHAAGVIAGCRDGCVRLFGPGLERLAVYRVHGGDGPAPLHFSVQSVALSPDGERLAAGTRGGAVVEVALATGSLVTRAEGHAHGAVTAAAAHPTVEALAATAGTDGTLRLWDMEGRRCLSVAALSAPASCVAWSPDGSVLAVGSGEDTGGGFTREPAGAGTLTLLRADTLEAIHECSDASGSALAVKFSPNGALLALASADGRAYVYDARGGRFSLVYVLEHGEPLRSLDFVEDSSALQAQTAGDALAYLDLRTGRQVASAASMRDAAWATWSASVGWPAQALWPAGADGTEVSRAERSHSRSLLAAGDVFGQVRLVRYPAALPADDTEAVFAGAHASTVGALTFSVTDRFLLTAGMHDCAAIQWRVTRGPADPAAADH
ncbi:Eml5, partial [Symbiodinium sp. KB8]